jgi:hypothetical protein
MDRPPGVQQTVAIMCGATCAVVLFRLHSTVLLVGGWRWVSCCSLFNPDMACLAVL